MATDFAIRVRMDVSNLAVGKPMEIVRRVLQVLETETVVITSTTAYAAGSRVYNTQIDVGTIGTTDYGINIDVDAAVTDDKKAEILRRLIMTLESETITTTTGVYSAGGSSVSNVILTVT